MTEADDAFARYGVRDVYEHPGWPLAKRLTAIGRDDDPSNISESCGDYQSILGLLADYNWSVNVQIANTMGLIGDWGVDDVEEAVTNALHEYREWKQGGA